MHLEGEINRLHWSAVALLLKDCMLYIAGCDKDEIDQFFASFIGEDEDERAYPSKEVQETREIEEAKGLQIKVECYKFKDGWSNKCLDL